jgi:riboflavin kinase/FMN adenylyltransferase
VKLHYVLPNDEAYRAERARHPLCLAVGVFDGFHLGHRAIIRTLLAQRRAGERTAVMTFAQHPIAFLRPGEEPPTIATMAERVNALARAGVDEAFILRFDATFAAQSPQMFLEEMVCGALGARALIVGENFRFGAKRVGDLSFARTFMERRGGVAIGVPNVVVEGERVSSTRIRAAIAAMDFETVDRLLGAPYAVRGQVAFGAGRGHDLGFPTANVTVSADKLLPPDGVYAIVGRYDGRDHPGLVSIGTNPTFNGTQRTVEAWLLDFNGSMYGEELVLRDFRFVRGQQKFSSIEALLEQMQRDRAAARFPSFT